MPLNSHHAWILAFAQFFSAAVIGIALTVLAGHIFNHPALYTWRGAGATSVPTATMNLLLALAVVLLAVNRED